MIRSIKDLSGGKSQMEQILVEEAERMTEYIREKKQGEDAAIEVNNFYNGIALNMVWNMVAGQRYIWKGTTHADVNWALYLVVALKIFSSEWIYTILEETCVNTRRLCLPLPHNSLLISCGKSGKKT